MYHGESNELEFGNNNFDYIVNLFVSFLEKFTMKNS